MNTPTRLATCIGALALVLTTAMTTVDAAGADTVNVFNPSPNGRVYATLVAPDGKVYVAGEFTAIAGSARNRVARLNADGSIDNTFAPGAINGTSIRALLLQPDGKLVIGGNFTTVQGSARVAVARLNADGGLDGTFNANVTGAGSEVIALGRQSDGDIFFGGYFTTVGGFTQRYLAGVTSTGAILPAGFVIAADTGNETIFSITVQPDDKIVVGGSFTTAGGSARSNLARFNAGGSVDATFAPNPNARVYTTSLQSDGNIVVGGSFAQIGGGNRQYIARITSTGVLDPSFSANAPNAAVYASAIQPDGRIVIGGSFDYITGFSDRERSGLARYSSTGAFDPAFADLGAWSPGTSVWSISNASGNALLVGGNFSTVNNTPRSHLAKLDPAPAPTPTPVDAGYWMVAQDGGVFSFGAAPFYGSTGDIRLNQPVVGAAATRSGNGYWFVAADGGIFSFGDARFFGSTGDIALNQPVVAMIPTVSGNGYWLIARDGGVFSFGDAQFFGSTGDIALNQPIVGGAATPSGSGYWFVAADGGIFSFGDAQFFGSTGDIALNQPIVSMAATPSGNGYWFVARDGGIFNFGGAPFLGSAGNLGLSHPVVSMIASASGNGYLVVASDGAVYTFGDAAYQGGLAGTPLAQPVIAALARVVR